MKKIISVLVALMMLVSVFSVSAFAAVNDAVLALRVTPTATSYKPGDVVTFEVSYESTSEIGGVGACTLHIGYDSSVFEPVESSDAGVLLKDTTNSPVVFAGYALEGKVSSDYSFVQNKGNLDAADTAKGWDASYKIFLVLTGDLFDASTETKVLAFKLKVKDTATNGTYAVGVTQGSINDGSTQVDEEISPIGGPSGTEYGFSTSKIFDLGDASVTIAGGSVAPSYTVNTLDAQVQWADKEAGLMNLGFRGQFVGFDVEADKGTTVGPNGGTNLKEDTQLKEVGIILTKGTGSGTKYPVHTVYNFKDGGYFYRLVVGNVSYTGTEEFSAKAYVVIGNDTFEASNTITTTGAAQYNRAKDQMGAK